MQQLYLCNLFSLIKAKNLARLNLEMISTLLMLRIFNNFTIIIIYFCSLSLSSITISSFTSVDFAVNSWCASLNCLAVLSK